AFLRAPDRRRAGRARGGRRHRASDGRARSASLRRRLRRRRAGPRRARADRRGRPPPPRGRTPMSRERPSAIYPLTAMQQGMLFHTLSDPASAVYVEQLVCTFSGELDTVALERAWQAVVERHAALRTAFVWEGLDEPVQVVQDAVTMPLDRQDWRGLA